MSLWQSIATAQRRDKGGNSGTTEKRCFQTLTLYSNNKRITCVLSAYSVLHFPWVIMISILFLRKWNFNYLPKVA